MATDHEHSAETRMIFMGESALTDGFRLIGFETHPDPGVEEVERIVRKLVINREKAFLILDRKLAQQEIPVIQQLRKEGGHILVTVVPPLCDPDCFHCQIDDHLQTMMAGPNTDTI